VKYFRTPKPLYSLGTAATISLTTLGNWYNVIEGTLRIGLGKFTTDEEIDRAADILSTAVSQVRQAMLVQALASDFK
jgi:cysteine sulfinate desulfinase/cysteine desulfurase-like protein